MAIVTNIPSNIADNILEQVGFPGGTYSAPNGSIRVGFDGSFTVFSASGTIVGAPFVSAHALLNAINTARSKNVEAIINVFLSNPRQPTTIGGEQWDSYTGPASPNGTSPATTLTGLSYFKVLVLEQEYASALSSNGNAYKTSIGRFYGVKFFNLLSAMDSQGYYTGVANQSNKIYWYTFNLGNTVDGVSPNSISFRTDPATNGPYPVNDSFLFNGIVYIDVGPISFRAGGITSYLQYANFFASGAKLLVELIEGYSRRDQVLALFTELFRLLGIDPAEVPALPSARFITTLKSQYVQQARAAVPMN